MRTDLQVAAAALAVAALALSAVGCGESSRATSAAGFERQVGKLCLSLGSQLRAVVDQTAFAGPIRFPAHLRRKVPPKLREQIEHDVLRESHESYEHALNRSEAVIGSILDELRRIPTPAASAALKSRFDQGLTDSASRLRKLGGSQTAREPTLVQFFRDLASRVQTPQFDVCKPGVAALEKEPLSRSAG